MEPLKKKWVINHLISEERVNIIMPNRDKIVYAAENTDLTYLSNHAFSPHGFTSLKWRSKSELFNIDKWK